MAGPAAASMLAVQWQLEQMQWWEPERLRAQQFAQIRVLVDHAVRQVPYYGSLLRAAGLKSVAELDASTFRGLPLLRKGDIAQNEASLTASVIPVQHGQRQYTHTTGSTGHPTRVAHTGVTQFFADALAIQDHLLHERDFREKYGVIKSSVKRSSQPGWGVVNALFATGPAVSQSSSLDLDAQLDWLMEERPGYLQSYSSNLLALVRHSERTGKVPQGLRQIIGYGDMPPEELPELAGRVWGARFVATYSSMELGPMASQCPGQSHYLVHAPVVYIEILRDDGEPCRPGEIGRVVATSLHNFAMPLIRYELGDYARAGCACPTGRGLPVLERVIGRYRNMLRDPAGRTRWPSFPGEMWHKVAPVRKVRLVQHELHRIEIQYVMERDLTDREQAAIREGLTAKLGFPFEFSFGRKVEIERIAGEKWEDFVSLVPER